MRIATLIGALGLAALAGAAARSAPPAPPPSSVSCESIVLLESGESAADRVVLGVVSVPPAYLPQTFPRRVERWRYWTKAGLSVRGGSPPVRVTIPKPWRSRASVGWGDGSGSSLRIASCPAYEPEKPWNGYAGGFYLRARSACVPLIFRVGQRTETVRFGIGRRCPAS
jgi:hypothetical protein